MAKYNAQNDLNGVPETATGEIVGHLMDLSGMEKPSDIDELKSRIVFFFNYCAEHNIRPAIFTLAACLGVSRITIYNWRNQIGCSEEWSEIVNHACDLIYAYLEQCGLQGKVNPATFIFLAKNWMGMKDTISFEESTPKADNTQHIDHAKLAEQLGIDIGGANDDL